MQKVSAKVPFSSNMLLQLCKTKGAVSPAALDALELLAQTCTHSCLQCKQQHVVSLGKMNPARVRPAQPKQCLRTCVEHFPGSLECKQRTETGSLMRLVMFNGGPALTEFLCVSSLEFKCFSWHMREKKIQTVPAYGFHFQKLFPQLWKRLTCLSHSLYLCSVFPFGFFCSDQSRRKMSARLCYLLDLVAVCVNRSELLILKASAVSAVFALLHNTHITSHLHAVFSWLHTLHHPSSSPPVHIQRGKCLFVIESASCPN